MLAQLGPKGQRFAIVFDLDETLVDNRAAWCYTIEQAALALGHGRIDARPLVEEYRTRPWTDALQIVLRERRDAIACAEVCERMYTRSSMKRLLVHEGTGMALDRLRGNRIEMGAATRLPHEIAIKQIQSTGLDRFLTVLSPTPPGEEWDAPARFVQCIGYMGRTPGECAYISGDALDLRAVQQAGGLPVEAAWAAPIPTGFRALTHPDRLSDLVPEATA